MEENLPILLVEDEPDQALLVQDALEEDNEFLLLQVLQSGEAAIAYLSGEGTFADRATHPFPFLMLLDLKMPGIGGFGVLRWLQRRPDVRDPRCLGVWRQHSHHHGRLALELDHLADDFFVIMKRRMPQRVA